MLFLLFGGKQILAKLQEISEKLDIIHQYIEGSPAKKTSNLQKSVELRQILKRFNTKIR